MVDSRGDAEMTSGRDWADAVCSPLEGGGTLARIGEVVLLVAPASDDRVRPLLDHVRMVAANGGDGRQLVRGFALQLASSSDDPPPFAALAPIAAGLAVFVSGAASVFVDGDEVTGRDSLAWAERVFPWPMREIVGRAGDEAAAASGLLELGRGVVRASGFTLTADAVGVAVVNADTEDPTGPVEAAPPAPAPAPHRHDHRPGEVARAARPRPEQEPEHFESIRLGPDIEIDPSDLPAPLPIISSRRDVSSAGADAAQVRGVFCKNHHFNDPRMLFCAVCGINMVQQTPVLVDGKRPPLGVIVLDDGSVFQLDTNYLLGRDPDSDDLVRAGSYRAIVVNDSNNSISRVHARLELRNWDVLLVDNASTNGTFFARPKSAQWERLQRGGDQLLTPGTRVRIGNRTLAFNSHRGV